MSQDPLQQYGVLLLLAAFRRMGVFTRPGTTYRVSALQEELRIIPEYKRLFHALLNILVETGYLELAGEDVRTASAVEIVAAAEEIELLRQELIKRRPELNPHAECLQICLHAYPEILTGKRSHMDVLFPNGSLSRVEAIYKGDAAADACGRLSAELIASYVKARQEVDPSTFIRILEVGAGTGASSGLILSQLAESAKNIEFVYSDLSSAFLEHGRRSFGPIYSFAGFQRLDLEVSPAQQGFMGDEFDLIFAGNVLHATQNVRETLNHLKWLLRRNGLLVINEITSVHPFATMLFGLTSGWWRYQDESNRIPDSPLLSAATWQQVLTEAGFTNVEKLDAASAGIEAGQWSVFVGESDGRIINVTPEQPVVSTAAVAMAATKPLPASDSPSATLDIIRDAFADVLRVPRSRVTPEATFEKFGVDSLVALELTKRLERDFGPLPATLLFEHNTAAKLAAYLETLKVEKQEPQNAPTDRLKTAQLSNPIPTVDAASQKLFQAESATEPIAIIGLAGQYPLADDLFTFWNNLRLGRNCVRPFPLHRLADLNLSGDHQWVGGFLESIDFFDPQFFGISPAEAEYMDPQERLWLETAWHVFEDAGYNRASLARFQKQGSTVGVFVGCMYQQYPLVTTDCQIAAQLAASGHWSMANRTSYLLHLQGPSIAIDTACSSSLTAIHMACNSLRQNECGMALAGGVNLTVHPGKLEALRAVGMLASHSDSRAFGDSNGLIPGEGVGAVLLKPLRQALVDHDHVYAVIRGSAINHGGKTGGYRVPNPEAQGELIRYALHSAQVTPESISYVEAAANGSPLGDPIEITGLQRGFCSSVRRIGSIKSNIGHLEAASGISQLTKVIGQLHENVLYPTIHTEPRNPRLGLEQTTLQLVETLEPWIDPSPRRAAISSFGAGGANAHIVVEESPLPPRNVTLGSSELVLLSANTTEQLRERCRQLITHLQRPEVKINFADLAYTLQTGRESLPERLAFIASSVEELSAILEQYLTGEDSSVLRGCPSGDLELAHLLEGQAGEAFLKSLVEARDLSRCARLWLNGVEVNWNLWHEGRDVYRVSLPGYPFARRRCWIQSASEPVDRVLHPLVHRNTSTLTEQRYSSRFSGTEVYLAEHRVGGKPVLPAAVLIEMARAAAELATGSPIYRLRNFNCIKPLQLDPGSAANIEIRLEPEETGTIAFTISSSSNTLVTGLADSSMTAGTVRPCPEPQGREILTPASFYEGCTLAGLQLGSYFRTVQSLRTTGEKVYAQLDLSNDDKRLYLTPGLLDGMLQTLAGFRYAEANQVLEVPFWIDTVEIHGALNGKAHVCTSRSPGQEGCYDLTAWNDCDQLAIQLLGVQTRPLSRTLANNQHGAQEMEPAQEVVVTSIEPLLQNLAGEILKLGFSEVPQHKNFLDFGFDSTSLVLFARRIGDSLGIEISPAELFARPTIAQLAKSLINRVPSPAQHPNHKEATSRIARLAAPKQRFTSSNVEPIAIIGMAGVFPGAPNLTAFWDHLASEHDLVTEAPKDRWDWRSFESGKANEPNPTRWGGFLSNVDQFDPLFFGISPREAAFMDPQQRLFLEVVWHAIEDAGYGPSHIAGTRTGLYVGVATSDYADLLRAHAHDVESQMATGIAHSILANRVSYLLDFRGPSQPIDTACSSSLVAIHHAVEAIRQGTCEMAIAGGVNVILSPILSLGFGRAGFMSPSGRCRAFSKEGDGYVRGEGAGAIFLKPLTRALHDRDHIHAVIRGIAVNHGGRSASLTAPNSEAQTELLVNAWRHAGVPADSISYIEAHGTGTALGDPIEILGLKEALEKVRIPDKSVSRALPCWTGSVKSNLGHLEAASGIAGVLKTVLALQHRQIPASLHAHEINPFLPLAGTPIQIVKETMPWPTVDNLPRRAGVSSFGFGGANAHIVLEEASKDVATSSVTEEPLLAVLSARNKDRLQAYAAELASFLQTSPTLPLADVCFTLCYGRDTMESRWAAEVSTIDELISKLQSVARAEMPQEQLPAFGEEWLRNGTPLPPATAGRRRVSLPGYPFARERHWFNVSRSFTVTLDPQEERIAHHLVGGRLVCAGAVLLNVALEAITPNAGIGLKRWNWIKPLVFETAPITLHVYVTGNAIRLESADGDVYAQGELSQAQSWPTAQIKVPDLPPDFSPDALYDIFAAEGVLYGSWFRRIDQLWEVAGGEIWAHYELPSKDYAVPPADLLDAAWQTASFLRLRTEPGLPFALADLSWSGPIAHTGWICVRSEGTRLSIEIAAEDGSVFVRLGELVLREWPGGSGLMAAIPEWKPKPTNYVEPHPEIWHFSGAGWGSAWGTLLKKTFPAASLIVPYEASSANAVQQICYLAGTESGLTETEQFLGFLQTLLAAGYGNRSLTLVVMTRQAQATGRELQVRYEQAGIIDLALAAGQEYSSWKVRVLDVADESSPAELVRALPYEANAQCEHLAVFREGVELVRHFVAKPLSEDPHSAFRDSGVYLILDAYDVLGSRLARYLATHCRARLILASQQPVSEQDLLFIRQLELLGATVLPFTADLEDESSLQRTLASAVRHFGPLNGVFLSAVSHKFQRLAEISVVNLQNLYRPLYNGMLHLTDALIGKVQDFVCVFSSRVFASRPDDPDSPLVVSAFQESVAISQAHQLRLPLRMVQWETLLSSDEIAAGTTVGSHIYTPVWDVVTAEERSPTLCQTDQVCVIGGTKQNLDTIRQIYPEAYRLPVSPTDSSEKIFHKLEMRGQIDHLLWIVSDSSANRADDLAKEGFIERQQQEILFGFRLIQALLRLGYGARKLSWTVITSQAHAIRASEIPNPAHAGVHGLFGSMAKEYPGWKIRLLDFEVNGGYSFDLVFAVPFDPKGNVWAYRYGRWHRQQLIESEMAVPAASLYRSGGVYVIIGGAGGIGEAFSEYLIHHYQAKIIWIGRRPKDAAVQDKLNRLAAFGSAPHYIAADATDRQALEQALQEIKAQYGAPHGVVHSAIVLSDKSLANMDETRFKAGLQAKLDISVRIAQVFAEEPLDFILLFSSIQSFIKAPGQSNYAAGCMFQDTFAAWLSNRSPCPIKVMNWGYWGSIGVAATEAYRKRMTLAGLGSIEPGEGMVALEKFLAGPLDQMAFIKVTKPDTIVELGLNLVKGQRVSTAPHLPSLVSQHSFYATQSSITPAQVIPPESEQKLKDLNELVAKTLWGQLQALGLCVKKKTKLSQWKASVHLLPLYERWFEESIETLAAHKLLCRNGDVCTNVDLSPPDMTVIWSDWDKNKPTWSQDPLLKAHVLLEASLKALPEILTGKRPATEIMFPNSSMTLVEEVYKNNPVSDYYNALLADAVVAYIQERRQQDPACQIRIFEIGAGTGGTSAVIFQKLEAYHNQVAEYCYTDISKAFLTHAKKEYGADSSFLNYRLFNAEEPLAGQQVQTGSYDLVIAANVLHATKNIRKTLQNAKALLKGNGRLLLNEITGKSLFAHLTFGLLEGWWLYEDDALRIPGCPGLSPETWQSILREEGFHSVYFPAAELHSLGQQIVVATSNGVIRQPFATATPQSTVSTQTAFNGLNIRWLDRWLASSERYSFAVRTRIEGPHQSGAQLADSRGTSAAFRVTSPESIGDVDKRLHQIVSTLLDIPVGELDPNVPLERYGLDSIVTLELSRMLKPAFGEVSPAVIFERQTIAALANYLDGNKSKVDGQESTLPPELLLLSSGKQGGVRSAAEFPSFWVHGAPGYAQVFRALAQGSESPVYAFQARGIDGGTVPFSDLDAMADYYYQCMVAAAPGRAVVIGGYSLGGVIALEAARRWHAAGNTVAQLVLLDTYPNTPEVQSLFSSLRDQGVYQILLANMFLATRGFSPVQITEADIAAVPDALKLGELARLVSERNDGRISEHDIYRALLGTLAVSNFTGEAFKRFNIKSYDASDVLFLRAAQGFVLSKEGSFSDRLREFRAFDYIVPWRKIIRTHMTVQTLDTDHFSLLGPESAPKVRQLLQEVLLDCALRHH